MKTVCASLTRRISSAREENATNNQFSRHASLARVSRGSRAGLGESERREMPPVDKEAKQAFNFTAMLDRLSTEDKHTPTHTHIFFCAGGLECVFPVHLSVVECGCVHAYTYCMWIWACPVVHISECLLYTWQDGANVCEWGWDSKWFLKSCVVLLLVVWWWWGHGGGDDTHRKEEVGKPDRCCASPPHYHHDHCHRLSTLRWRRLFHHRVGAKTVDENKTV